MAIWGGERCNTVSEGRDQGAPFPCTRTQVWGYHNRQKNGLLPVVKNFWLFPTNVIRRNSMRFTIVTNL